MACELTPDVIIMDISMSGLNGIEATRQILEDRPGIEVIALSMHSTRRYVTQILRAGAAGYILKDTAFKEIAQAIRGVVKGQMYLSPKITGYVVEGFVRGDPGKGSEELPLTRRESEVLQLLAESKSTKEIADLLNLGDRTVETHRRRIMDKLGIRDIAGLTKYAIREGLVSLDS